MKKPSIEQIVFEKLRTAILNRELAAGTQLVELTISNELKVSRTPIRNAMKRLADQGLVDIIQNRGAFVVSPTLKEVEQAYELRSQLEVLAVRDSIHRLTKKDYAYMKSCIQAERLSLQHRDISAYLKANMDFHLALIQPCKNVFLVDFITQLLNRTDIYVILYDSFFDDSLTDPKSPLEHEQITEAIMTQDLPVLEQLLYDHAANTLKSLSLKVKEYKSADEVFREG